MPTEHDEQTNLWPAPCRGARRLLGVVAVASGLIAAAVATHLTWSASRPIEEAEAWMRAFSLSAPALWPAGSPLRHPETLHPGIDLRMAPGMERLP